ncbi:RNA polymerase sigma-70 factor, ECF subfamily [Primorskyibacter flagellatus]|uniref:RNA polymerase sigma-70 factor, ECF subfamily n=2 Tax=Primorskyibacter flagellatus TaxID=1387277 RepID=A0A1W2BKJ1_9RHOB|nr:RNA polymerase sigma-70 factor, ECF subfamily [Primorskyibacter flagellatus]
MPSKAVIYSTDNGGFVSGMTPQDEIEALLAQVALGDRSAFAELYRRTSAKLFGVVLRVLDNRSEAEEVLQDVYVRIWNKAGLYRVNGLSPMTWLITLSRNLAIDRRRARVRRATSPSEAMDELPDPSPGPEAQAIAKSTQSQVDECFDELPQDRADMLRRVYLHGESYAELAAHLDAKLNTVRTWLRRSLMDLRECLSR